MKNKIAISVATLLLGGVNLLNANETTKLDDVQVVTTAGGYEQKITDAPASISVISQKDLQSNKYSNLAEAIQDVEGVDVRDGEGKTGGLNISIRGMGSANTLILIDGIRQNSGGSVTPNGFGETAGNFLPPLAAIERIEVIRGPMSTLYGSDAMGGVVNIITKKVANEWTGSVNVDKTLQEESIYGNSNNVNMYLSGPIIKDTLGLALRGNYYNREASKIFFEDGSNPASTQGDKGRSPVEGTNWSLGGKLTYTPVENHDIFIDAFTSKQSYNNDKSQLGGLDSSTNAGTKAPGYKDRLRFEREELTLGHTSRFDIGTLESSIMYNETKTIGRTLPSGNTGIIGNPFNISGTKLIGDDRELKSEDIVVDTKFVTDYFDRNIITVGGQYWKSEILDGLVDDKFKQNMWALFLEDEISITDSLALTLGGRYDYHDFFNGHFSPRAYAVYTANDNWTVKGGVSQGYKAPSVNDLHDGINSVGGQGTNIGIGSPHLKPEKSTNYETGVYYNANNGFSANATLFYNEYKDKIETDGNRVVSGHATIPNGTYSQKKNIGKAETKGLEFGTQIPLYFDSLNLRANYTFMESEQKSGKDKGESFATTPKHSLNATLNWQATQKLSTWFKAEYKSDRKRFTQKYENLTAENKAIYNQIGDIKAYDVYHLGANYKWNKDLTFNATIYNLFNKDFSKNEAYTYNNVTKYKFTETSLEGRRLWLAMNLTF